MRLLDLILAVPAAVLYVAAAVTKWSNPEPLARLLHMASYPNLAIVAATWALPPIEFAIGIAILFSSNRLLAKSAAASLLVLLSCIAFHLYYVRDAEGTCGCFGELFANLYPERPGFLFLRNAVILIMLLLSISIDYRRRRSNSHVQIRGAV